MTETIIESSEVEKQYTLKEKRQVSFLLFSILLIGLCGITYELLIGTISSYLIGNSVYQFSITIGLFMSSMGLGSYLSKFIKDDLLGKFILIEVGIGLIGGLCSIILFAAYLYAILYEIVMYTMIVLIGSLVGLELPLLTRIINQFASLRVAIARALSWDYFGALIGSISFPLFLLPHFGLINGSVIIGLINLLVAIINILIFRKHLKNFVRLTIITILSILFLVFASLLSGIISQFIDNQLYSERIVYSKHTKYQKLVVTMWNNDLRMYINHNLQFSSRDEYRYHESLVHVGMSMLNHRENVLILGGGDGLAANEVLKYKEVKRVTLVDLDPDVTDLCRNFPLITAFNNNSLNDSRVKIINQDAYQFVEKDPHFYDFIGIDLPDPNNESLSKLYSESFYRMLLKRLTADGIAVTQSASPFYVRKAFWCIHNTIAQTNCDYSNRSRVNKTPDEKCQVYVLPYHAYVPSFGIWGFNIFSKRKLMVEAAKLTVETRYLTEAVLKTLFIFPKDLARIDSGVNRLINPILIQYYWKDWRRNF